MTGSGIESDFVLPDSLSYRIIAHCQLSISILAQTVDFFAQLAYRRIHLRLFAPQTIPEALPLDSAKGSSTLWTPFRAIELVTSAYRFRVRLPEGNGNGRSQRSPSGLLRVHAHAAGWVMLVGGRKGSLTKNFQYKSSNMGVSAPKVSKGRSESPLVASAEAKSPATRKFSCK